MSTYMNPHFDLIDVMAQARANRAQLVNESVVKGARFIAEKFGNLISHLQAAHKQRAAVAQLMALDDRMLQDIGLNRALVPFVVTGSAEDRGADLYADVTIGVNANDNHGLRQAA